MTRRTGAWVAIVLGVTAACTVTGGTIHVAGAAEALAAVASGLLGTAGVFFAWRLYRHAQLSAELRRLACPAVHHGVDVLAIPGIETAFVAGLRDPRIFCGRDLPARLDPDELRAVLDHERFHQIDHAPAKLAALQAVAPLVRFVPGGRAWVAGLEADLEIAADRYALARGASHHVLASAILKLSQASPLMGPGFTSAAELRVRALLEPDGTPSPAGRWHATAAAAVVVCLVVAL